MNITRKENEFDSEKKLILSLPLDIKFFGESMKVGDTTDENGEIAQKLPGKDITFKTSNGTDVSITDINFFLGYQYYPHECGVNTSYVDVEYFKTKAKGKIRLRNEERRIETILSEPLIIFKDRNEG